MEHLSLSEFSARYARRPAAVKFTQVYHRDLHVDSDGVVSGIVEGSLYVRGDAHVLVSGIIHGRVHVDREAVLWVEGVVEGAVMVKGAACVNATCGSVKALDRDAVIHDPGESADQRTIYH